MKVIVTGGTGMVGGLVLENCLNSDQVKEVISFVRRPSDIKNDKLKEVVVADFLNYDLLIEHFMNIDVAFFCIGVYTGAVPKEEFRKITVDYPVAFAKALYKYSPSANFCLLSGAGADRSEKSRTMFARDKGAAENQLSAIGFKSFHAFRPGYIYPVEPRKEPNLMYTISRWLYPLIRLFGKNASIKSTELAQAMFNVGMKGYEREILENRDILDQL